MNRIVVVVALACSSLFVACGDAGGGGNGLTGDATAGKALYETNCASCHGATGEGTGQFPSVVGEGGSEAIEIVTNGEDAMPAFGGELTEQEIADVVAYVETL
jgi:mono/diheme cytochrome c family protein